MTVVAPKVLAASALLGLGPGSFGETFGSSLEPSGVATLNLQAYSARFVGDVGWVSVLAQIGLVGVCALLAQVVVLLLLAISPRLPFHLKAVSLGLALVLGLGMFASYPVVYRSTSAIFWYSYGLIAVAASIPIAARRHQIELGGKSRLRRVQDEANAPRRS